MHSAIGFVPPALRHRGHDISILEARRALYERNWCEPPTYRCAPALRDDPGYRRRDWPVGMT